MLARWNILDKSTGIQQLNYRSQMKINNLFFRVFGFGLGLILIQQLSGFCSTGDQNTIKPFRVVVIIGDQWQDPMSYMVTKPKPTGEYSGNSMQPEVKGAIEFYHLTILLKSWGIPFDIIRLDQQFLDRNMFLGIDGKPKYGTIIWDVNQSDKLLHPDYSIIQNMVEDFGIGLIALSDRIHQPEIQAILGVKYIGSWGNSNKMEVAQEHFLTLGLNSPFILDEGIWGNMQQQQVEILKGTNTLIKRGPYPQSTSRVLDSGSRAVWIGQDNNFMFYFQDIRTLLRRAITWTIGYNLYKTWENDIIMIMDDPGNAQNAWLEHFHYPTLSEEEIEQYLIKPLQEHNAILNINFVAGFVNDKTQMVEPSWTQQFVDEFGTKQDYVSSKLGYDKGVKLGVFEVMCHGLTHMQPDLSSEPGWYGSALDQERAEVGWYREFGDTRRHKEIPAAEQLWRMKTARNWLVEQFGVMPLQFCHGGGGTSLTYPNNTFRLAGQAGFGWYGWSSGYLGRDMVVVGWDFKGTPNSPQFIGSLPNGHDFGITKAPDEFATIFEKHPKARFFGINEYVGYMHASNSGQLITDEKPQLNLVVDYDPHYCWHFAEQPSSWILELSDWVIDEIGETPLVKVDGKALSLSKATFNIPIPAGIGKHYIEISKVK